MAKLVEAEPTRVVLSGLRERCGLTVDYNRDYSTFEV